MSKPIVCSNDEPAEDDKTGKIEQCGQVDNKGQSQARKELLSYPQLIIPCSPAMAYLDTDEKNEEEA